MDSYRTNLYQLAVYLEAMERGNLTRAAEMFMVSQPVVSRIVRALEKEYGAELTRRDGSKLLPTPAGEAVLHLARETLRAQAEAREAIRHLTDVSTGRLRVGITTSAYERAVVFLARFYSRYPHADINVRVDSSNTIANELRDHELDVGIVISSAEALRGLRSTRLWDEEIVPVVSPDHPLRAAPDDPDLWRSLAIITTDSPGHRGFVAENLLPQLPPGPEYPIIQRGSHEFVRELAHEGVGLAALPRSAIEKDLAEGRLTQVKLPNRMLVNIRLVVNPRTSATPLREQFCSELRSPAARRLIRMDREESPYQDAAVS